MRRFFCIACAVFASGAFGAAGGSADFDAQGEARRFSQMYFAPMDGLNFFRLYAPGTGIVEFRRNWHTRGIDGAGGWRAAETGWRAVETNGEISVQEPGSRALYRFRGGRPSSMVFLDGARQKQFVMQFEDEPVVHGEIPTLWDGAEDDAREEVAKKWQDRLKLFYENPNHAAVFLAELALLGLFAFLYGSRKVVIAGGAAGCAAAAYFLVKTAGRGGVLGLALGALLLLGFRFFRRGGKVRTAVVSALAVAVVVVFCFGTGGLGWRLSAKTVFDASTSSRLEKWRHVPRMMVDSPHGWGATPAGRAYMDWYQPLESFAVTPTLDSDHLTYMTGLGWFGRFAWAGIWLAVLFVLFRFAAGGGAPLPLAVFSTLGLAAMFNPLLHEWTLWLVPVASLWPFVASRPWKAPRRYAVPAVLAAVASLSVCAGFYFVGREPARRAVLPVFADGRRVCVCSHEPDIWFADDRDTLGYVNAPKEIRYFYLAHPQARALGYVQKLADVPPQVRRLAVAGSLCSEYVKLWQEGNAPKAEELIFLSPGMPIDAVPGDLRKSCKFAFVVGEFAARYEDVYGRLDGSNEVVQLKGAEVYLPGWVGYIVEQCFQEGKE